MSERSPIDHISGYAPEQLVFLAGAGISLSPPTSLPTVYHFLRKILQACGTDEGNTGALLEGLMRRSMPPRFEVLIDELRKTNDSSLAVSKIFDSTGFNSTHGFLDQMLEAGASVITTNFDNCIENASQSGSPVYHRVVFGGRDLDAVVEPGNVLAKIHGSNPLQEEEIPDLLITVHALARAAGGFRRFPVWRALFESLLRDRLLVVIGYSGSDDFDLTPMLLASQPRGVLWLNYEANTPPQLLSSSGVPTSLQKFTTLPHALFAKGDLGLLLRDFEYHFGLRASTSRDGSNVYAVGDYVREIYPSPEKRAELLNVLYGHFSRFDLVAAQDDQDLQSPLLLSQRVQARYVLGLHSQVCEMFESLPTSLPRGYPRTRAQFVYSASLHHLGQSQAALDAGLRAVEELVTEDDKDNRVQLLNHIGGMHFDRCETDDAIRCFEEVRRIHQDTPVSIESEASAC